tara:strand:- start:64 stop:222 length:159 start_codon:yes stop_codon:yes gene_type:complete
MTNETERLWAKNNQQEKCKLCSEPALQGWKYANQCEACYSDHVKAMDMLWVL